MLALPAASIYIPTAKSGLSVTAVHFGAGNRRSGACGILLMVVVADDQVSACQES